MLLPQETLMSTDYTWRTYARYYDLLMEIVPYRVMLDTVCHLLAQTNGPILDAGCGTGNLSHQLAHSYPSVNITACDISHEMLAAARGKYSGKSIRFVQADLNKLLPFSNETFRTIVCTNVLYAVENPKELLNEFHRMLMPDGVLLVVTPQAAYENGLILRSHARSTEPKHLWRNMHASEVRENSLATKALGDKANEFLELIRHNREIAQTISFSFFSPSELTQLVLNAGFIYPATQMTYAEQNILLTATKGS